MSINWFSEKIHPTDAYIHWAEQDPKAIAAKHRPMYDKIAEAGLEEELVKLLQLAYEAGYQHAIDGFNEV